MAQFSAVVGGPVRVHSFRPGKFGGLEAHFSVRASVGDVAAIDIAVVDDIVVDAW